MRGSRSPKGSRRGTIIVTGGAGFIGSHLVERLLDKGNKVVVIDDLSTGSLRNLNSSKGNPHLTVLRSRISECRSLKKVVAQADFIFHLAAAVGVELVVRSPIHVLETNLHETEVLFEAATLRRVPVLIASTSEVYGKTRKRVFSEGDDLVIGPPHQGRWSYACSKLMDEFLALAYSKEKGLPVIITRLFNTVGPRQTGRYGMVLPRFIQAARNNQPLRVYGDGCQTRCFGYVQDTVEALVRLQQHLGARGEVFNIGSTEEISILHLAKLVIRLLNSKSEIEFVPYNKAYEPGFEDMRRRKPLVRKLEQLIGYKPHTSLEEIILRTAEAAPPVA